MSLSSNSPGTTESSISPLDVKTEQLDSFVFYWMDTWVHEEPNQILLKKLQKYFTYIKTSDNPKLHEDWFKNQPSNVKIFLVVSPSFGKIVLPHLHSLESIVAVYVICPTAQSSVTWGSEYSKIRKITSESDELFQEILEDLTYFEKLQDSKAIQIFNDEQSCQSYHKETYSFLWYKLFIKIILSNVFLPSNPSFEKFIKLFDQRNLINDEVLNLITKFNEKYCEKKPIAWLIENTPLSRFIKKALRDQNISMIFYLRFFLIDIYNQLKTFQSHPIYTYKIQFMSLDDIENIRNSQKRFLMFNGFLFTSKEKPELPSNNTNNQQYKTVLIEIFARHQNETSPFASVKEILKDTNDNDDKHDSTIIFMCASIFQILSLEKSRNDIWSLKLSLVPHKEIQTLYENEHKLEKTNDLLIVADLLEYLDEGNKGNIYCKHLLEELPIEHPLLLKICDKINKDVHPIRLQDIQYFLIGLKSYQNELSSAMLTTLCSLTNDSILIYDNVLPIDFEKFSNKKLKIFTNSKTATAIHNQVNQSTEFYILDIEDEIKIDETKRFSTINNVIFELFDQISQSYKEESKKYSNVECKILYNQIRKNILETHRRTSKPKSSISTTTTIIWLKSKSSDEKSLEILQNLLEDIDSNYLSFNDFDECHDHLLYEAKNTIVFLILDGYCDKFDLNRCKQLRNVKRLYVYNQSVDGDLSFSDTIKDLCLQLNDDLIEHYNQLASKCKRKNDTKTAKEMLSKARHLCRVFPDLFKNCK